MTVKAIKPRYMLAGYLFLCFVFAVAAMNTKGTANIALAILVFCFESVSSPLYLAGLPQLTHFQCCFATIFTLALRGLGRHTKRGGSFLVAAISGGAAFPPMMGAVVTKRNAHVAMAIPMMGYIMAWLLPLYVNFFNHETMDTHRATELGIVAGPNEKELALEQQLSRVEKETTTIKDM